MLEGQTLEAFVKLYGEDEAAAKAWWDENVGETNRAIKETGAVTRAKKEPPAEDTPAEEPVPAEEPLTRVVELDPDAVEALARALSDTPLVAEILASITQSAEERDEIRRQLGEVQGNLRKTAQETERRLGELEDAEQERQADMPAARSPVGGSRLRVTYRPREARNPDNGDEQESLADVAASTLANVPEARVPAGR